MKTIDSMLRFLAQKVKQNHDSFSSFCRILVNEVPEVKYGRGLVFEPENYNGKQDRYFIQIDLYRNLWIGTQLNGASKITWRKI